MHELLVLLRGLEPRQVSTRQLSAVCRAVHQGAVRLKGR
jgi:hypothetical protein